MKRITVKELKAWLADKDDNANVYLEKYENEHIKEYIILEEYDDTGKLSEAELLVSSVKVEKPFKESIDE